MRTIATAIFIFVFISLVLLGESVFSYGFCEEFETEIKIVRQHIENGEESRGEMQKLVDMWEERKNSVFIFADHKGLQEVESSLYNAKYCVDSGMYKESLFYIDSLYHRIKEFGEGIVLTPGNLF